MVPAQGERRLGYYANLLGVLAFFWVPFLGGAGALAIYLRSKNAQARDVLNFHLTLGLLECLCLPVILVGWVIMLAHGMSDLPEPETPTTYLVFALGFGAYALLNLWTCVWTLVNIIRSAMGKDVAYPLTFPLVR